MIYIDFDGVILDTAEILFEEWRRNPNRKDLPEIEKIKYIQKQNWNYILNNSPIINDSVYCLKNIDPQNSFILTKIHSLENEGYEKVKWIREQGIKQNVILVPYIVKKSNIVDAKNNLLIDDCLKNLDEWEEYGGTGILFDKDNDNFDSWNQENIKGYQRVLKLDSFKNKR